MPDSETVAIAAHLHVLLRRKTGRVTDTEWMATNAEYAAEIVRFARARAAEDGHEDLAEWATRLEVAVRSQPPSKVPLVEATRARRAQEEQETQDDPSRYVGGLR